MTSPAPRRKLEHLSTDPDGTTRYLHPHGYVIERQRRTWSERTGRIQGSADWPAPLIWWTVFFHIAKRASMLEGRPAAFREWISEKHAADAQDFDTLRGARAWCDEHPRDGWAQPPAAGA